MMQHVATAKSEVAAFATTAETNSFTISDSNEQFGKLLQEQKSNDSIVVKSENTAPQTSSKNGLQRAVDEVKNAPTFVEKEATSKQNPVTKDSVESASEVESTTNNLNDEQNVTNTKAELQLIIPPEHSDDVAIIESAKIDIEEWVLLVDNLQKLANIAQLEKRPLVDSEAKSLEVSGIDLRLPNKIENGLLQQILDKQKVDELKIAQDETSLLSLQENRDDNVNIIDDGQNLAANKQAESSLSMLVDKALGEILSTSDTEGLTDTDVRNKTAELLLEQTDVLQDIISQLNIVSQKTDVEVTEQETPDTTNDSLLTSLPIGKGVQNDLALDSVVASDSLLTSQQVETSDLVDLTLEENNALLRTLLVGSETEKSITQEPVKLAKTVMSDAADKPVQDQQVAMLTTQLESVIEQDVKVEQVAPITIVNSTKVEKMTSNNDIKNLLNLTDTKLDKVLENIAQRMFDSKPSGEPINPEQIAQQVVIPKAAEIINSVGPSAKDFISALKSGLEEFKNQLSQGRDPGIDLKALVSDALAKTSETGAVSKAPVNLEQMLKSVSQVLDFAATMNSAIAHNQDQVYNASSREAAQIQGEQSKQVQFNQFESKFEKAININKPEGHQQLAEKVRWMVNTKNLVAEIRLDPAELGSVHVKVAVSGESATVNFLVQSQHAKEAVDNATPRLREMLADKGIELGQSSVRQESNAKQEQGNGDFAQKGSSSSGESENVDVPEQVLGQQNIVNGALGGIDYFV